MGLETRGKHPYFYKKRREGNKVRSIYLGSGLLAIIAAQLADGATEEKQASKAEWQAYREEQAQIDALVNQVTAHVDALTDALMLVCGHHLHKRQWRKSREQQQQ